MQREPIDYADDPAGAATLLLLRYELIRNMTQTPLSSTFGTLQRDYRDYFSAMEPGKMHQEALAYKRNTLCDDPA